MFLPLLDVVLFDVDDTLYSTTVFAEKARRNAVRAMVAAGFHVDEAHAVQELGEVVSEFASNYEYATSTACWTASAGSGWDRRIPRWSLRPGWWPTTARRRANWRSCRTRGRSWTRSSARACGPAW